MKLTIETIWYAGEDDSPASRYTKPGWYSVTRLNGSPVHSTVTFSLREDAVAEAQRWCDAQPEFTGLRPSLIT